MVKATKPLCKRIAVVFDFDDTLVPDKVDSLAESCGLDSKAFRLERIQRSFVYRDIPPEELHVPLKQIALAQLSVGE